ncbi:MAG TPA: hypothetical protein VE978_04350 [Chitinophagales bacterium]|nr:hypothetical protein [Chitinophagales bacterium]
MKYFLLFAAILFSSLAAQSQNPTHRIDTTNIKQLIDELTAIIEANGPVIIDDDFSSNKNRWYVGDDSIGMTKVEDHVYKIKPAKKETNLEVTKTFDLNDKHDWKIEAEMVNTGNDDQAGYGICFGSSKAHVIDFAIFPSGDAVWEKDGAAMDGADVSQYMNKGAGETNKLTVQHVTFRDEWSFRLNDKEVFASKNYNFYGNRFGILTETTVNVTHFRIYDWSKSQDTPDSLKESDYGSDFFDSFHDNAKEWELLNDEDVATSIASDAMRQELKTDITYSMTQKDGIIGSTRDFRIDLLYSRLSTADTANTSGIVFKKLDKDNQFYFGINGGSQCKLFELKNGDWNAISGWITTKAIRKGNDVANLLSIEGKNKRWYFRINGTTVYSCAARRSDGEWYGWRLEGIEAIKVKLFNICQAHVPTIRYVNAEEEAPYDATKFSKQFVDLMCAAPGGFPDYVGDVTDRHDDFVGYESKLILSGGDTYYFYERGKSGKKFHGWLEYDTKEEGEKVFNQIKAMIEGATSPCFSLEKTDGKPQYPDGVSNYIEWQDKKTKELVQLSLELHGAPEVWMVRIIIGKREK